MTTRLLKEFLLNMRIQASSIFLQIVLIIYQTQEAAGTAFWVKLNESPVCFGARKSPGSFKAKVNGTAFKIAIVYKSGGVTCHTDARLSPLSCTYHDRSLLRVYFTDTWNRPVVPQLPTYPVRQRVHGAYQLSGYTADSKLVVFPAGYSYYGYRIQKGRTFRLWYGEALLHYDTANNRGKSCADVFALV